VTGVTYNAYYDQAPKGSGTGENDYSAQMDAYKTIDRMTLRKQRFAPSLGRVVYAASRS
jgi:hypothetical protein